MNPKTAIKRKDAKHAEERKGKYRETILTGLVIFFLALRLGLSLRTLRRRVEIGFSRTKSISTQSRRGNRYGNNATPPGSERLCHNEECSRA
jgi:hypothetical protein